MTQAIYDGLTKLCERVVKQPMIFTVVDCVFLCIIIILLIIAIKRSC